MIEETYINNLTVLVNRFLSNYNNSVKSSVFLQRLKSYLIHEELEDIGQTLELFKLESKNAEAFKDKVIHLIMHYVAMPEQEDTYPRHLDIDFLLGSNKFSPLQQQLWEFWLVDGLTVDELADHYSVGRSTIYQMLHEFKELVLN